MLLLILKTFQMCTNQPLNTSAFQMGILVESKQREMLNQKPQRLGLNKVRANHIFSKFEGKQDHIEGEWYIKAHIPLKLESHKCNKVRSVFVKHCVFMILFGHETSKFPPFFLCNRHEGACHQKCSSQR